MIAVGYLVLSHGRFWRVGNRLPAEKYENRADEKCEEALRRMSKGKAQEKDEEAP